MRINGFPTAHVYIYDSPQSPGVWALEQVLYDPSLRSGYNDFGFTAMSGDGLHICVAAFSNAAGAPSRVLIMSRVGSLESYLWAV